MQGRIEVTYIGRHNLKGANFERLTQFQKQISGNT